MKKSILLLLLALCLTLSSCLHHLPSPVGNEIAELEPEALVQRLETALQKDTAQKNYSYASDWLDYYELDNFDYYKLLAVEDLYAEYFIREVPPANDVAKQMIDYVMQGVEQELLNHKDKTKLTEFLISAYLVSVGDKYANYFNKEDFKTYMSDTTGNFVGIGVTANFNAMENTIEIVSVMAGSSAETAGVLVGDYITAVEGESVESLGYYNAIQKIRGEIGTEASVTIRRGEESFNLTIPRMAITEQTVYHRSIEQGDKKVGYVQITTFSEVTVNQFKDAVDQLENEGVNGIIFDLRNNGGGLLTTVLSMLDYLLPDNSPLANYLYYDGSTGVDKGKDRHKVDLPFAVLCNAYTASAAELFTCALQDYAYERLIDGATVVGDITYGKGTMQSLIPFKDETAITVSMAYYQPPYSENYEGKGIIPDVQVSLPDEFVGKNPQILTLEQDTQLQATLAVFAEK